MIKIHVSVALYADLRLLLVQEEKPENHGKWNLPGGHLEFEEAIQDGARREAREETHLEVRLTGLLGVYTSIRPGYHAIRFVFLAEPVSGVAAAGHEVLAVHAFPLEEIEAMPDEILVSPQGLRQIIRDLRDGKSAPLSHLYEPNAAGV